MMKFRCIKSFEIEKCNNDGLPTGTFSQVIKDSIWDASDAYILNELVGRIKLEQYKVGSIEMDEYFFKEHFEIVKTLSQINTPNNMNYISAEEFERQSKEVQNVFLEWWKPVVGEVMYSTGISFGEHVLLHPNDNAHEDSGYYVLSLNSNRFSWIAKKVFIPLLTESMLRKFIEEKICNGKISTEYYESGYKIFVLDPNFDEKSWNDFDTDKTDLLEAYWQVACEISKHS